MRKLLLAASAALLCITATAQSAIDTDFETGNLPEGWTVAVPATPYQGGFSVVTYGSQTALKTTNVGTNDLGGTYVLKSLTGGLNNIKGNSDNWLVSPDVTIGDDYVFTFRLAANCSYSPYFDDETKKMKLDVLAICGGDTTRLGTVVPVNYFTWKQYAFDLSQFKGKSIRIAFHDYGIVDDTTAKSISDMKFIDNIRLTAALPSDYSVEAITTIHGQAEYTTPYSIRITNYGISKGKFDVSYSYNSTTVKETITSDIASGQYIDYTFKQLPVFVPGDTVTVQTVVSASDDAMTDNNVISTSKMYICNIQSLPYSICNSTSEITDFNTGATTIDITGDEVQNEFETASSSTSAKWTYMTKYHACIYSLTNASKSGASYLFTNKAFTLPAGKVYLTTIGTATLSDNYYEVYIAKYGAKQMADYATKVGESALLRDVTEHPGIDTTTVELNIPEASDYVIAIRPMTATKNAQMAIVGYSLSAIDPTAISPLRYTRHDDSAAYNLAGQRVAPSAKGIIIRNAKKYLNK